MQSVCVCKRTAGRSSEWKAQFSATAWTCWVAADVTEPGRLFHTRAAATEKALSPTVLHAEWTKLVLNKPLVYMDGVCAVQKIKGTSPSLWAIIRALPTCGLRPTSPCELAWFAWTGRAVWVRQQAGLHGCYVARTGLGQSTEVGPSVWLLAGRLGKDGSVRCLVKISVKSLTYPAYCHITLHMHT